jgi:PhnB protein
MTFTVVTHLNFRGQAREALAFYQSVFGGETVIVTFADGHSVQAPSEADQVMWGQVMSHDGFRIMAFDVPSNRPWSPGEDAFYVSLSSVSTEAITARWDGLRAGGTVLEPLSRTGWAPLYGKVKDRFGVTWVLSVPASATPS